MTINSIKIQILNKFSIVKNNVSILLYLTLGLILFFSVLALYSSLRVLWLPNADPQALTGKTKAITLRLDDYEFSVKRIKAGAEYLPPAPLFQNPFATK